MSKHFRVSIKHVAELRQEFISPWRMARLQSKSPSQETHVLRHAQSGTGFSQRELAFVELPKKYNPHGIIADRSSPFVLWAHANVELPAGKQRLLLRSRNAARLYIDDMLVVENPFQSSKTDGHNAYRPVESKISPRIRPLQPGDHEELKEVELPAGRHRLRLEVFVGMPHPPQLGRC